VREVGRRESRNNISQRTDAISSVMQVIHDTPKRGTRVEFREVLGAHDHGPRAKAGSRRVVGDRGLWNGRVAFGG
jgi:hypothetical protein